MTPDQLITFATVAEHANISRAAVALHLSQPAVSGQLRQLQDEFGEPLYQRAGRGIRLTAAGEQLAVYATRIRETVGQAHAYRNALRGLERGTLRIGASTTPASYLLPYLIAEFHRQHPDVTVHTIGGNTTEIIAALGSLDIAMIEGPAGADLPPGTEVAAWREDEIVAIAPSGHPLAGAAGGVTLKAICAHSLVLREGGSGVRQLVERACARSGVQMRVVMIAADQLGLRMQISVKCRPSQITGNWVLFESSRPTSRSSSSTGNYRSLGNSRIAPPDGLARLFPHLSR